MLRVEGNIEEAMAICRRCIGEFPRNGQAYVTLAGVYLSKGQRDDAIAQLEEAVSRDRRCYSGYRLLADQYSETNQLDRALSLLQHILTFKPNDHSVQQQIATLQQRGAEAAQSQPGTKTQAKPETDVIDLSNMAADYQPVRHQTPQQLQKAAPASQSGTLSIAAENRPHP